MIGAIKDILETILLTILFCSLKGFCYYFTYNATKVLVLRIVTVQISPKLVLHIWCPLHLLLSFQSFFRILVEFVCLHLRSYIIFCWLLLY